MSVHFIRETKQNTILTYCGWQGLHAGDIDGLRYVRPPDREYKRRSGFLASGHTRMVTCKLCKEAVLEILHS